MRRAGSMLAVGIVLAATLRRDARAADQLVLGRSFTVKDPQPGVDPRLRSIVVIAKELFSPNTLVGDPLSNGAAIDIIANGGVPTTQTVQLPGVPASGIGSGWRTSGSPIRGYVYADAQGLYGPVRSARVMKSGNGTFSIKVVVKATRGPVVVIPPAPGTDGGMILHLHGGDDYCVNFGGAAGGRVTNSPAGGLPNKLFKVASASTSPTMETTCPTSAVTTTTTTSTSSSSSAPSTTGSSTSSTSTTTIATTTSTSPTSSTASTSSTSTSSSSVTMTSSTSTSRTTTSSSSTSTSRTSTTTSSSSTVTTTSTSTSRSTTSSSTTSTTSSSTSTTAPCPTRLRFSGTSGTTSCGGPTLSPAPAAPFSGAIFNATTGGVPLVNLGLACLDLGGGGNAATAPNSNPDGGTTQFGVAGCSGPGANLLTLVGDAGTGAVAANGNPWNGGPLGKDCSLGSYPTKHCTKTGIPCASDDECGGAGWCNPDPRCLYGSPLPVPNGSIPSCLISFFRGDASGTVDRSVGTADASIPLASYIFATGASEKFCRNGAPGTGGGLCTSDADCSGAPGSAGACQREAPCPICESFGTGASHCVGGASHGQACTPVGSKMTTADCLPKGGDFIARTHVDLSPLRTATVQLTGVPNPARSGQYFFCPVGAADSCAPDGLPGSTCQRTQGCFGQPTCKRIQQNGTPAGNLNDGLAHAVTLASVFCVPASGNALVDGGTGVDLPGPGAVSIRGVMQIVP